jgi:hypothetical protein
MPNAKRTAKPAIESGYCGLTSTCHPLEKAARIWISEEMRRIHAGMNHATNSSSACYRILDFDRVRPNLQPEESVVGLLGTTKPLAHLNFVQGSGQWRGSQSS